MAATLAAASSDPVATFTSYGVAAPLLIIMYAVMRKTERDAEKRIASAEDRATAAEARNEELTERLLTQQAASLPLLTEAAAVIRATGNR